MNVYECCPAFTTARFTLRLVRREDAPGLLSVYSDPAAQRCFNADNCTSDFCYTSLAQMEECVDMWLWSYAQGHFVRWTVLEADVPVGTVEMFCRDAEDGGTGVLRLDLLSCLETAGVLEELLCGLLPAMHRLFGCEYILTKALPGMTQRCKALTAQGFRPHPRPLAGHGGVALPHYWGHRHKRA